MISKYVTLQFILLTYRLGYRYHLRRRGDGVDVGLVDRLEKEKSRDEDGGRDGRDPRPPLDRAPAGSRRHVPEAVHRRLREVLPRQRQHSHILAEIFRVCPKVPWCVGGPHMKSLRLHSGRGKKTKK